ncbi:MULTISPECIES: hypothetical protein [unclassified Novosphingobium]|uniref:hypothetical protein n=1 Tax=unclassified Novosphingobium TaxID=2644732 RepID=UPI0025E4EAAC|nr:MULTISPECIES: hypothetical protein [unclassified Novosphingobium]HQV02611.1 hypothetical protein [Novosphingobium sp.]
MGAAFALLFVLNVIACVVCLKHRCLLHCDCNAALILPTAAWFAVEASALPAYLGPLVTLTVAELGALVLLVRLVDYHDRWLPIVIGSLALIAALGGLLDLFGLGMAGTVRRAIALTSWALASGLTIASGIALLGYTRLRGQTAGIAPSDPLG